MVSRKFRVRKKRYGKNNKGATFIHNVMMGLVRKREAEKMARENGKRKCKEKFA